MKSFFEDRKLNSLTKRMQKGDSRAAEELYGLMVNKVFGFCMNRVSHRQTAEDLSQEIFLKLIDRIETFDERRGSFSVWFWQLARNTVTDHYRLKQEITFVDIGDEAVVERAGTSDPSAEHSWELGRVKEFLKTLGPEEQELFELRFVADLSYRNIARVLGKSEGSLRVAVNRLKDKVQEKLQ